LGHYRPFLGQYLGLLALAIAFEILAFVLPMWSLHRRMKNQKETEFLAEADRLSQVIESTYERLENASGEDRDAAKRQLAELAERYQALENAPTWPIDRSILRQFTLRNLGLLMPFVGYLVGHSSFWQQLSDVFAGLG
jgi:hypothetical protein